MPEIDRGRSAPEAAKKDQEGLSILRGAREFSGEKPPVILVADDDPMILNLIRDVLTPMGYRIVTAEDGREAIEKFKSEKPDLAILDIVMPGFSGLDIAKHLKEAPGTRLFPVVIITALNTEREKLRALEEGVDEYIQKPINIWELKARVQALLKLKRYTDELENAESVLFSLALSVEARDRTTGDHCTRLAQNAVALGRWLGLPESELKTLHRGGYLHDIGKIGIPDAILAKPERLEPAEWEIMRQHSVIGERLCRPMRVMRQVLPIIRHHHERWDGSGYPDGLAGEKIPLHARILQVADIYDALRHPRPYKPEMPREEAFRILRDEGARGWREGKMIEAFIEMKSHGQRKVERRTIAPA